MEHSNHVDICCSGHNPESAGERICTPCESAYSWALLSQGKSLGSESQLLLYDVIAVLVTSPPVSAPFVYAKEFVQALVVPLDAITLQEHICSAVPTVVEDYKGTAALNRELEVDSQPAAWMPH